MSRRFAPLLALALPLAAGARPAAAQQPPRVAEIQIAPRYLRMVVDAQAPLVATAYDRDGIPMEAEFRWSSSNINVAEVGADGVVRGVAQGTAVITARTGEGRERKYAGVTVFVGRPGRGGVVIAPVPQPPKAPGIPGTPEVPVPGAPAIVPPPGPPGSHARYVDSIVRASIDCNEPFIAAANPMRACYDVRPRMREGSRMLVPPPAQGECPGHARGAIGMMLRIGESGEVAEVRTYSPTGCAALDASAESRARALAFMPAQKDGRAVPAWVRIVYRIE